MNKENNFNLVSYWALAYNCIVIDKIMIYISMVGLLFLGFFAKIGESAYVYSLLAFKCAAIIFFASTLIISLILLKANNKIIRDTLNNQDIKNGFEILDQINFGCCLIGICTLVLFILFK